MRIISKLQAFVLDICIDSNIRIVPVEWLINLHLISWLSSCHGNIQRELVYFLRQLSDWFGDCCTKDHFTRRRCVLNMTPSGVRYSPSTHFWKWRRDVVWHLHADTYMMSLTNKSTDWPPNCHKTNLMDTPNQWISWLQTSQQLHLPFVYPVVD